MNRPETPTPTVSNSRRKLIRAGFAVPVIATVASGSALAATSATCFAKQFAAQTGPGTYPGVTGSPSGDTYMRVQLGVFTTTGTSDQTYYVDGNNLSAVLVANPGLIKNASYDMGTGKFQQFDTAANSEVGSILSAPPTGGTYQPTSGRFAVLRFSSNGTIVGVGRSTNNSESGVQQSCWSSLRPTPSL